MIALGAADTGHQAARTWTFYRTGDGRRLWQTRARAGLRLVGDRVLAVDPHGVLAVHDALTGRVLSRPDLSRLTLPPSNVAGAVPPTDKDLDGAIANTSKCTPGGRAGAAREEIEQLRATVTEQAVSLHLHQGKSCGD